MATTFAQGWSKISAAKKALNELYKALGVTASTNFVDLVQTYQTTTQSEGREAANALNAWLSARETLAGIIRRPTSILNPDVKIISRSSSVKSTKDDVLSQIADIYFYMANASPNETVTSRGFVRGSFSSGSPYVGNGTFKRIWLDEYGYPIESAWGETYTLKCERDQNTGANFKGQEQFSIKGLPFVDELEWTVSGRGSGLNALFNVVNADNSKLANAGFSVTPSGGDSTPSGTQTWQGTSYGNIGGWLVSGGLLGTGADILVDRTNYYQETQKDNGSPAALRFTTSKTIFQPLKGPSSNNVQTSYSVPTYAGIKCKADANGQWTGTIALTLGSKTWTKTVTTETGWFDVSIDTNDAALVQTDAWYKNWKTNDAKFQIAITKTSGAATYLMVARALLVDYIPVVCPRTGGPMFYLIGLSGATPFQCLDTGTFTDTEVGGVVVQTWAHRAHGRFYPARPAAPTAAAPTVALSGTAGSVTTGTHKVAVSFVDTDGIEGPIGTASSNVTGDGAHNVDVTVIPTGGANIAKRKLYMTKAGTSTPFYYAGITINDNVTTTATGASGITVADASLVTQPVTITIAEP